MAYIIRTLGQENAAQIADHWKYPGIYSFYDMTEDPEDYEEIISPVLRGDRYYEVLDDAMNLIGFFAVNKKEQQVLEIGLGMKPELTGQGNGGLFLQRILAYLKAHYPVSRIELAVASFNQRAIKLYEKVGFHQTGTAMMAANGSEYEFVFMSLDIP